MPIKVTRMKLFKKMKDGGAESTVTGYWLIEHKKLFSIVLLKFEGKSREAFHSHAFNCFSWVLKGWLVEEMLEGDIYYHEASFKPFITRRDDFHKVDASNPAWVLTFRGPWAESWNEYLPQTQETITLTSGRVRKNNP
jgi:hypothetical protein